MRCVSLVVAASVFSVSAVAQESQPTDPLAGIEENEADEELSELELLSRSEDDPFAGVIESEQREPVSVTMRALNKTTARYTDIEIEMNQIARFGSLEIQPRTCDKRPPEEFPETTAFLEIFDTEYNNRESDLKFTEPEIIEDEIEAQELEVLPGEAVGDAPQFEPVELQAPAPIVEEGPQAEGVNIFRGWMFASSPALNALEHPVYDVWVIDCTTQVVEN
ncbi:DUF2155 domain-containing protein [Hyphococcus flavus]|uniref:DUF2155 domain-containing protein n=1 Tax=Hyphococcus flavus TaxID=1866326 RepID=A0AAF0CG69_9PROT|nr:DUF2155 domain-containing protein [Hyphococcus flavus]WDI32024.1 DUF2155 domain-containing protein [Hyphococcus flavus]